MQHITDIRQYGDWWRAVCSCGWRGPKRATSAAAIADKREHEAESR